MRVFISHSSRDKPLVREVISYFPPFIQAWVDEEKLLIGDAIEPSLKDAIQRGTDYVIIFLGKEAIASEWVRKELKWALDWEKQIGHKIVLPVLLDGNVWQQVKPDDFRNRKCYQCHDFTRASVRILADTLRDTLFSILDSQLSEQGGRDEICGIRENDLRNARIVKKLSRYPILCFDVDGTLLEATDDQTLSDARANKFIGLFSDLVNNGYRIAVITGNDYGRQFERVLQPIINAGLGDAVTFFSDGGSRVFEYDDGNFFQENETYSRDTKIDPKDITTIEKIFQSELDLFFESPQHKTLKQPDLREVKRTYDKYGSLRLVRLELGPFNENQYSTAKSKLKEALEDRIQELRLSGNPRIAPASRFLHIDLEGVTAAVDAETLRPHITDMVFYDEQFSSMAVPKLEKRGGTGFTSQLALKPFKRPELRNEFFRSFSVQMLRAFGKDAFDVTLGGRTTIDIQRSGVNKQKAIKYLYDKGADPDRTVYFGDEFYHDGNDVVVCLPQEKYRPPTTIVHVGHVDDLSLELRQKGFISIDGNGVDGTANYLNIIDRTLSWR